MITPPDGGGWEENCPRDCPDGYEYFYHHSEIAKEDVCVHSVEMFNLFPICFKDCNGP